MPVPASAADTRPTSGGTWVAVVPVKPFGRAKSRLAPLGDSTRRDLAAALAHDTIAALASSRGIALVVVVTDELALAGPLDLPGVVAVPDGHGNDLNETLRQGAAEALRRRPGAGLVAVCADLPALTADAVDDFLSRVPAGLVHGFVPDAPGDGTTTYVARDASAFAPRFGVGSAAAHLAGGAVDLADLAPPALRHDVDSPDDLAAVVGLGAGERTRWALTHHRL